MDQSDSRILTVLLTDMRGASDISPRASRTEALSWSEKHKQIVVPAMQKLGGRLVKTVGDSLLLIFDSATDAVLAGVSVQEELAQYNSFKAPADRLELRIVVNVGEVTLTRGDIIGEPVNVAVGVQEFAQPGDVFFTEAAYLAMNKAEVPSSEVGALQIKGLPEKVRVYKVRRAGAATAPPATATPKKKQIPFSLPLHIPFASRRMMTAGATLLVLGALISFNSHRPAPAARGVVVYDGPLPQEKIDQGACQEDLKKFCPGIPHGGGKQAECLRDHLSELTADCTSRGFMKDYAAKHPAWAKEHGQAPK